MITAIAKKAITIASMIAGPENIQDRLRDVEEMYRVAVLELSPEVTAH